jgi:hypothetical protein
MNAIASPVFVGLTRCNVCLVHAWGASHATAVRTMQATPVLVCTMHATPVLVCTAHATLVCTMHAPADVISCSALQAAAEAHIVSFVAKGFAPPEWGCDAVWEGGDAVLEKCVAVFGVMYSISDDGAEPAYLRSILEHVPDVAGAEAPAPFKTLDLYQMLPKDKSYYSYAGSLVCPHVSHCHLSTD